jgi:transcriptional regulator with XRE-family HTH domain
MAACRKRAGLSQEQLSELLFCARSNISKIEKNHRAPKMDFMMFWDDATNSRDALVAFFSGEEAIRLLINKLQEEGHWQEELE